ncbi:MAG TPA: CBS domain-containing protein [Thermoanaerobaculia bacterium]|nr:CBS domain-containing protein [Thermoanaerobaculia bacterium]HQR68267.1 CBS domain-containing protein [Thermoanaerobaculia bacterium]
MKVRDVMHTNVETVDQEERADAAYNLMRVRRIHHLIVTAGPEIVGVLSERDLGGRDREAMRLTHKVLNFMTPYAVKAKPEMTVRQAANLMRGWSIGCLPVVERGRLAGIITVSDLLDLVAKGGDTTAEKPVRRPAAGKAKKTKG